MPRSSSNSRNKSTSSSPSWPSMPPPKIWHQAPPMRQTSTLAPAPMPVPQATRGFGQIVKEGIGFGVGAEIGRTVIQSAVGLFRSPPHPQPEPQSSSVSTPPVPAYVSESYTMCLQHTNNDITVCSPFLSKETSPWTQCMETNLYQKEYCTPTTSSTPYRM